MNALTPERIRFNMHTRIPEACEQRIFVPLRLHSNPSPHHRQNRQTRSAAMMIKVGVWRGKLNHVFTPILSERCEPIEHRTNVSPVRCRRLVYRLYSAPNPQRVSPVAGRRRQYGHNLNQSSLHVLSRNDKLVGIYVRVPFFVVFTYIAWEAPRTLTYEADLSVYGLLPRSSAITLTSPFLGFSPPLTYFGAPPCYCLAAGRVASQLKPDRALPESSLLSPRTS